MTVCTMYIFIVELSCLLKLLSLFLSFFLASTTLCRATGSRGEPRPEERHPQLVKHIYGCLWGKNIIDQRSQYTFVYMNSRYTLPCT